MPEKPVSTRNATHEKYYLAYLCLNQTTDKFYIGNTEVHIICLPRAHAKNLQAGT
jgi:hypothetical protein